MPGHSRDRTGMPQLAKPKHNVHAGQAGADQGYRRVRRQVGVGRFRPRVVAVCPTLHSRSVDARQCRRIEVPGCQHHSIGVKRAAVPQREGRGIASRLQIENFGLQVLDARGLAE